MTLTLAQQEIPEELFVEQAEYIEKDSLLRWSSEHPEEENIIQKLTRGGAKLISGPRGCGKRTLLLKAYYSLLQNASSQSFPVFA